MSTFSDAARELDALKWRVEQLESQMLSLKQGRTEPPRTAYRPSEVAAMTGFKAKTIQAWIREGRLDAVDMGGRWAVPAEAVEKLLDTRSRKGSRAKGKVQADVPRTFWSVKEFAAALGVSLDTVYRMTRTGELAFTWVGGEKRIPNTELERLLAEAHQR
jgi:excisionase family DNA binding protein